MLGVAIASITTNKKCTCQNKIQSFRLQDTVMQSFLITVCRKNADLVLLRVEIVTLYSV